MLQRLKIFTPVTNWLQSILQILHFVVPSVPVNRYEPGGMVVLGPKKPVVGALTNCASTELPQNSIVSRRTTRANNVTCVFIILILCYKQLTCLRGFCFVSFVEGLWGAQGFNRKKPKRKKGEDRLSASDRWSDKVRNWWIEAMVHSKALTKETV